MEYNWKFYLTKTFAFRKTLDTRCISVSERHQIFMHQLQLSDLLYSLWGRPVAEADKSCLFLALWRQHCSVVWLFTIFI